MRNRASATESTTSPSIFLKRPVFARVKRRTPSSWVVAIASAAMAICSSLAFAITTTPLSGIAAISTGATHTCARTTAGALKCWGSGASGQIGDNAVLGSCGFATCADVTTRLYPVDVPEQPSSISKVSAGLDHTCSLATDGTVKCWGSNISGQVGNGSETALIAAPERVLGVTGASDLSAGNNNTCVALPAGDPGVQCWGANNAGKLGDLTTTASNLPRPALILAGTGGYKAVAAGDFHTCALSAAGDKVRCWGNNEYGQTGGTGVLDQGLFDVIGLPAGNITAIVAGETHSCAMAAGKVYCWGDNRLGRLGRTTPNPFFNAVAGEVPGITGATAIVAGPQHTCALDNGAAKCWGNNAFATLGDGTTTVAYSPTLVSGLTSGVTAISQRCAVVGGSGNVKCWGRGAVGDGEEASFGDRLSPVNVIVPTDRTPDPFAFSPASVTSVALGSVQTSSFIQLNQFDDVAPITIVNGEYSQFCNGPFTSRPSNLPINSAGICVRHTASSQPGTTVTTILNIGGQTAIFSSTTAGTVTFDQKVRNVVTSYYLTILGRQPDTPGLDFWAGEANRVATTLGADVKEVFYAMAIQFFSSAEYSARNRTDDEFIADMYQTFFSRAADRGGLTYWQDQLTRVASRSALLNSFLFSPEFASTMSGIFGSTTVRPEIDLTMDLFRGVFGRLPDSLGFNFFLGQIRTAQCTGASAVSAKVTELANDFFASQEYGLRARTDRDFMGDVYNTYLRRGPGGDTDGFNYWVGEIGRLGRNGVRAQFVPSAEFQGRVAAIVAASCIP